MNKLNINELDEEFKRLNEETVRIKLNIPPLDTILNGGIQEKSDVIQIVGESATYKTSVALQISKEYCKQGKHVLYINAAGNITDDRIKSYGLMDNANNYFHFYKKSTFDDVCCILDKYIQTKEVSLIIIDSVADLINKGFFNLGINSKGKTEGISIDDKGSNYDSKPLTSFIKKYTKLATELGYSMILINQLRTKMVKKIGTVERRHGPKIIDYSCTYILRFNECKSNVLTERMKTIKEIKPIDIKVIKSNSGLSDIKYPTIMKSGMGISTKYLIIYYLMENKVLTSNGTYYELGTTGIRENGLFNLIGKIPNEVYMHYANDAINYMCQLYNVL